MVLMVSWVTVSVAMLAPGEGPWGREVTPEQFDDPCGGASTPVTPRWGSAGPAGRPAGRAGTPVACLGRRGRRRDRSPATRGGATRTTAGTSSPTAASPRRRPRPAAAPADRTATARARLSPPPAAGTSG